MRSAFVSLLLLVALAASSWAEDADALSIEINGETESAWIEPVDAPELGPAGDLVRVEEHLITRPTLEGGEPLRLRDGGRGRLFQIAADGSETLISLRIGHPPSEDSARLREIGPGGHRPAPRPLDPAVGEAALPLLAQIDPRRCALEITLSDSRGIPALSRDLRWLTVDFACGREIADLRPLTALTELRLLSLRAGICEIHDFRPLRGLTRLRSLRSGVLPAATPTFPERERHDLLEEYERQLTMRADRTRETENRDD